MREVLAWHEEVGGFVSVGRELRSNIEDGRIYVFTPGGHVLDLPEGSTPVDFAYRVHTQIGQRCVGALIDGHEAPLNTRLSTGQRVEIVTDDRAQPSRDWLDQNLGYVRTARALAKVQAWFRSLDRDHNVAAGRAMLETEFDRLAMPFDLVELAVRQGYADVDALCLAVAVGERQLLDVGRRVQRRRVAADREHRHSSAPIAPVCCTTSPRCWRSRTSRWSRFRRPPMRKRILLPFDWGWRFAICSVWPRCSIEFVA